MKPLAEVVGVGETSKGSSCNPELTFGESSPLDETKFSAASLLGVCSSRNVFFPGKHCMGSGEAYRPSLGIDFEAALKEDQRWVSLPKLGIDCCPSAPNFVIRLTEMIDDALGG